MQLSAGRLQVVGRHGKIRATPERPNESDRQHRPSTRSPLAFREGASATKPRPLADDAACSRCLRRDARPPATRWSVFLVVDAAAAAYASAVADYVAQAVFDDRREVRPSRRDRSLTASPSSEVRDRPGDVIARWHGQDAIGPWQGLRLDFRTSAATPRAQLLDTLVASYSHDDVRGGFAPFGLSMTRGYVPRTAASRPPRLRPEPESDDARILGASWRMPTSSRDSLRRYVPAAASRRKADDDFPWRPSMRCSSNPEATQMGYVRATMRDFEALVRIDDPDQRLGIGGAGGGRRFGRRQTVVDPTRRPRQSFDANAASAPRRRGRAALRPQARLR